MVALLALPLLPRAGALAQSHRATLQLKWTADSSWDGSYYQKPHRFHVHEELDGRLVFEIVDSAFVPRKDSATGTAVSRPVRTIQLREDGTAIGALLVEAVGTSSYSSDTQQEGGDCAVHDADTAARTVDPPFAGQEEANAVWDPHAPGPALIVFRGGELAGVAFSPKGMLVRSSHRLLCPQPETVRKLQRYRITARSGELLPRGRAAPDAGDEGHWSVETGRTAQGGYTSRATYRSVVRQRAPAPSDPAAATGRLEVTKTVVVSWNIVEQAHQPDQSSPP
jgi:hypothetical protein